jgi:hypothetical protein
MVEITTRPKIGWSIGKTLVLTNSLAKLHGYDWDIETGKASNASVPSY